MGIDVKICGLSDEDAVSAAVEGGAAMVGFVFFPPSPRYVTVERAAELLSPVPKGIIRVGLVVDADDDRLADITANAGIDLLQLHGSETPERVRDIRQRFGLPVMKVLGVLEADDVRVAGQYEDVADRLMFDAKPPVGATRPGGNARAFDWSLLSDINTNLPWMLAGGLTAENVGEAVNISRAGAVDVSSGIEDAPGRKSLKKIAEFLAVTKNL
ncbi:MAG: phosphoribosylanthranilate isomerase [Alphaproteobacteria bacterium]|jgi:phosphoribosylanthranilate isomerase|nr:phosphoribosylanthranilate isomerase [Alphaproteobacteria bacterium]MBT7943227.1 phosphoribosylanthranilate isomerase [Alphaproteobacteria bacterium]